MLFGTAARFEVLRDDNRYRDTLRHTFTLLVPENGMKFGELEPKRGQFDFSQADALVNFARLNGMWVRGHTLVWGQYLPDWLTQGNFTRAEVMAILKNHIETVVGHYRGQVVAWDVVNEAMDGSNLRDTFWLRTLGPDFVRLAYMWAHEADPHVKLYYNDWGDDEIGPKFDAILALVTKLRSQGVQIDGVGLESHYGFGSPLKPRDVQENMRRLKDAGLEVYVSEMDVQISVLPGSYAEKLHEQADIFRQMAELCRVAGNCHSFTVWGVTDQYSWIPTYVGHPDAPLLFDTNYQPKPAYYAVRDALFPPQCRLTLRETRV